MTKGARRWTLSGLAVIGGIAIGVFAVAVSHAASSHPGAARMMASADWNTYSRQCQKEIYAALTGPQFEKMVAEEKKEAAMGYVAAQISHDCLAELRK